MPFFGELEVEQSRAWFLANKDRYEVHVRQPLASLVTDLAAACKAQGIPLTATPKTGMFRPNRDVRFGRDKSPYRTNAAAMLSRTGLKRSQGVLYVQAGITGAYAAMGFYVLTPDELKAVRTHILRHAEEWREVEASLAAAGLTLARENQTTRLPKGITPEAAGDLADTLRLKSWIVRRKLARGRPLHPGAGGPGDGVRGGWNAIAGVRVEGPGVRYINVPDDIFSVRHQK